MDSVADIINVTFLCLGEYVYHMCLAKLTRGIFWHTLFCTFLQSQLHFRREDFRKGLLSFLFMLFFLETEQKSYREISSTEISAKVQPIAMELTPVADSDENGEIRLYVFAGTWLEKGRIRTMLPRGACLF